MILMSFVCSDIENCLVLTWRKTNLSQTGFVLSLLTALFGAVANLLIKNGNAQAGGFTRLLSSLLQSPRQPALVAGLLLTGILGLLWLRILATQKFCTCYPLFVSLTYSLISVGSYDFLHEKVSIRRLVGRVVIITGIMTLARG
jgi:multidrug transporter EmrE-like cation transporter